MIFQRSVKVKHKAEVKDKHNSCVLSASGDEPNLTSRTAAWQPEINAHVALPLEWCASDFFFYENLILFQIFIFFYCFSFSFFFFGTTLPPVRVDVFSESSRRQKTFAHSGGSKAMKTSGNQPPGSVWVDDKESLHITGRSDVQDQQNKYSLIAICVVGGEKTQFLDGRWKTGHGRMFVSRDLATAFIKVLQFQKMWLCMGVNITPAAPEFTWLQRTWAHYEATTVHCAYIFAYGEINVHH